MTIHVQVDELFNHIIFGVILVVGTLLFFLGLRNAIFVGLAIPMSMFISFIILNAFGVTLNIMVLFSLILALGRLVDDGIVIVENIYRHMSNGEPAMIATRKAVGEVTMPIVAATTATVMVFVPLIFWPGIMGQFMKWMPITFMVALSSSLFVALVVNPALSTQFMKVERENPNAKKVYRLAGILAVIGTLIAVLGFSSHSGFVTGIGTFTVFVGILGLLNLHLGVPGTAGSRTACCHVWRNAMNVSVDLPWPNTIRGRSSWHHRVVVFRLRTTGCIPPKVEFFPSTNRSMERVHRGAYWHGYREDGQDHPPCREASERDRERASLHGRRGGETRQRYSGKKAAELADQLRDLASGQWHQRSSSRRQFRKHPEQGPHSIELREIRRAERSNDHGDPPEVATRSGWIPRRDRECGQGRRRSTHRQADQPRDHR
ncbi:MAG: efflux RND transporter permease subunit [Flavobacteriales bacterium]|nr:efflux RND transporter permease subunit [Flavobacteriales bacterium]